jgi:ATP-dependent protease Clp ATPase subunit
MSTSLKHAITPYRPALKLEAHLPRVAMHRLRILFGILFLLTLIALCASTSTIWPYAQIVDSTTLVGLALLFGSLWLKQICIITYHNWHYFHGLASTIGRKGKRSTGITYDVAQIWYHDECDSTKSFLTSAFGRECFSRLEVDPATHHVFLDSTRLTIPTTHLVTNPEAITTISNLIEQLYELDASWQAHLTTENISKELLLAAVQFVETMRTNAKLKARWWSRDALSHVVGIGSELSYGNTPLIDRYSEPLLRRTIFTHHTGITPFTAHHAKHILDVLASHSSSNVLLIGPVGVGKIDVVHTVAKQLADGEGLHALQGHHVVVINTERLLSAASKSPSATDFLHTFFAEALAAGNMTLVIPSLHDFLGSDIIEQNTLSDILETYLAHPHLHIIALDTPEGIHAVQTAEKSLLRHFEKIIIEPANHYDTIMLLMAAVPTLEARRGVYITYRALLTVVEMAERYLTDGVMPDRAIALLERVIDTATVSTITSVTVTSYVSDITGIAIGVVSTLEREQLLSLEQTLTTHVVGQPLAVKSVADTLRRTRIDTSRTNKPRGSFLFLGPTGVGKTALAKALALVHGQRSNALVRFDMSEFSHADALGYLIGDHNGTGMLTDQLRDHPYSVVLLDEFEKAHQSIHDLFLQILDEGYYTSTHGTHVDARNTIIIATSNAGGALIARTSADGDALLTTELVRHLIETGVFRPELLNRFDETIIFRSLDETACRYIIQKNLAELTERLHHDGYTLSIDEKIIDLLLEKGFSPEFGARSLARVVQQLVEASIAKQIIELNIKPGGTVYVTEAMVKEAS